MDYGFVQILLGALAVVEHVCGRRIVTGSHQHRVVQRALDVTSPVMTVVPER